MEVTIKRIGFNETHLVIELFNKYRVFYKKESDIALAERFITERLKNNESVIFVGLVDYKPVDFTQLYPTFSSGRAAKNWILNDLYVEADQRKLGIGSNLIAEATKFAKADGATYLQLETAVDNYTAQHLYEATGFVKQQPDSEFLMYRKSLG